MYSQPICCREGGPGRIVRVHPDGMLDVKLVLSQRKEVRIAPETVASLQSDSGGETEHHSSRQLQRRARAQCAQPQEKVGAKRQRRRPARTTPVESPRLTESSSEVSLSQTAHLALSVLPLTGAE